MAVWEEDYGVLGDTEAGHEGPHQGAEKPEGAGLQCPASITGDEPQGPDLRPLLLRVAGPGQPLEQRHVLLEPQVALIAHSLTGD